MKNRSSSAWHFFSSVRLTIILLIILAVVSIFGTVLPQQEGAVEFIRRLDPGFVSLLNSLQLFDMYHSVWFRLLIFFLALNLIICSMNRFPKTWKLFHHDPRPDRSLPFKDLPPERTFTVNGKRNVVGSRVTGVLGKRYKSIRTKDSGEETSIYGETGKYTLFSVYLTHLSVLLILIGAIIGSLLGFKAHVNIVEGKSTDTIILRKPFVHEHKELDFSVHCEKFSVEFYDNGAPKEFRSDLHFIVDGKMVREESVLVNHPATFRGVTFYQSSYGVIAGDKARITVARGENDSAVLTKDVEIGQPVPLPNGSGHFVLSGIREDFMKLGTAALISISTGAGEKREFWVFKDYKRLKKNLPQIFRQFPKLNPSSYRPYTFYLNDIEFRYYTGLQVNKDPGVAFVYTGFAFIMIGLFLTFFTSYRQVWVRIQDREGKIYVSVAGRANKNPVGMERELDQIIHRLKTDLAAEKEI